MRQLLLFLARAGLALTLVSCTAEGEPVEVQPIKDHLDRASAAADAANEATARADELSAAIDGATDEEGTEDGDP